MQEEGSLQKVGDEFMQWVGYCITSWADIEETLFDIVWECLGCTKRHAAIVFFDSPTIHTRRRLADQLVASLFPAKQPGEHDHPDLRAWRDLFCRLEPLMEVRNRIAHQPVTIRFKYRESEQAESGYELWKTVAESYMSDTKAARHPSASKPALTVENLKGHYEETALLSTDLFKFRLHTLSRHVPASGAKGTRSPTE
jgi:hypothetical protein